MTPDSKKPIVDDVVLAAHMGRHDTKYLLVAVAGFALVRGEDEVSQALKALATHMPDSTKKIDDANPDKATREQQLSRIAKIRESLRNSTKRSRRC